MEKIYAKGLYFNKNHKDTPEEVKKWKKGGVAIHIDNFTAQLLELKSYADEKGYIKFDLVENEKDGEKFLSFKLNTYKKEAKTETAPEYPVDPSENPPF
jgi:predicted SpoU family rRNA methylase